MCMKLNFQISDFWDLIRGENVVGTHKSEFLCKSLAIPGWSLFGGGMLCLQLWRLEVTSPILRMLSPKMPLHWGDVELNLSRAFVQTNPFVREIQSAACTYGISSIHYAKQEYHVWFLKKSNVYNLLKLISIHFIPLKARVVSTVVLKFLTHARTHTHTRIYLFNFCTPYSYLIIL